MNSAQGTIVIRPKFFFLSFLLILFKPKGSINGHQVPLVWRRPNPFPVPPGRYEVGVWCPYLFFPRLGYSAVVVDVMPGAAVEVAWSTPIIVFMKGPISARPIDPQSLYGQVPGPQQMQQQSAQQLQYQAQPQSHYQAQPQSQYQAQPQSQYQAQPQVQAQVQAQAAGGAGSSWQPDPTGRHQYRWWDGTSWAANVSDGGVTSHDPL